MPEFVWTATSPLHAMLVPGSSGAATSKPGVVLAEQTGFGLFQVMARRGRWAKTASVASQFFGVDAPARPAAAFGERATLIWSGADQFMALLPSEDVTAESIHSAFDGIASVSDQSAARCLIRVSGPRARDVLAKISSLDFHPAAFPVGAAATTAIDHISTSVWREADAEDGSAAFGMLVFTSFAQSIWGAIIEAAAEYGMQIVEGGQHRMQPGATRQ